MKGFAENTYSVGGTVDDQKGHVSYISVTIRGNGIEPQSVTTGTDGGYSFSGIPAGEYNIIANCNGVTQTIIVYHGGEAAAMSEVTYTSADQASGCYMVNTAGNQVVIWTRSFSTYAISYLSTHAVSYDGNGATSGNVPSSVSLTDGTVSVTNGGSKAFTITPDTDYTISDVLVDGKSVGTVNSYILTNITAAHTINAVFAKASGLPYYLDESGNKVFIGFASDKDGEMKYLAPKGETVLFTPNPKNFPDTASHWSKSYIDFVTKREVFVGTRTNVFSPDTGMTRAILATAIGRLYERSYGVLSTTGIHAFTDCNYTSWYGFYIDWCSENGIITGRDGGHFVPKGTATRAEVATILNRFIEIVVQK